jgi:hypothetical protein
MPLVIPGRLEEANPESIEPLALAGKWIPGSMLSHRPGMTATVGRHKGFIGINELRIET